jgi:hypothetical protein
MRCVQGDWMTAGQDRQEGPQETLQAHRRGNAAVGCLLLELRP